MHANNVVKSCRGKIAVLRRIAGSGWGCSKETLIACYKTYLAPSLNYAAPVWAPNISSSAIERLQRVQSAALRVVTGCVSATRCEYLNQETKIMPVAAHIDLLGAQYLASALQVGPPSHSVVTSDPGPRRMKETLYTKYIDVVAPFLTNGVLDPRVYKSALSALHSAAVSMSIDDLGSNYLIGCIPPAICDSEKSLLRRERTLLAQLRSGDCVGLQSYLMRIERAPDAICPECRFRWHTTAHFFDG